MSLVESIGDHATVTSVMGLVISALSIAVNVLFFQLMKSKSNETKYLRRKLDDIQKFLLENRK